MQPYHSKITGDLVIEETVKERRLADPGWVKRHKRSLGGNKQHRACIRADHEARKILKEMASEAEKKNNSKLASDVNLVLNNILPKKLVRGLLRGRKG